MRTISLWLFVLTFAVFTPGAARAQESPTQQQIDQINGEIQDIYGVLNRQDKRIAALETEISDLQNKMNQPTPNYASADDLKNLAAKVKDLAQKQQDDNELVLKELGKLAKSRSLSAPSHKSQPDVTAPSANTSTTSSGKQNGFYYEVQAGNTLSAIAKAYTDKGYKVTVKQILDANSGLDPKNLVIGKKIFIPNPNAK